MALKGQKEHIQRLRNAAGPELVKAAGRVLYVGADMIRSEAFRSISEGSVSGKGHVPSKPGEPPKRDTGVLQAHIEAKLVEPLIAEVSSNAPYSAPLEFGSSRIAERPFMRPARDKCAPKIQQLFTQEIGKLVKGQNR